MTLENLRYTTAHWCMLSSKEQLAYMFGFLECKRQVEKLLEKENEKNKEIKN